MSNDDKGKKPTVADPAIDDGLKRLLAERSNNAALEISKLQEIGIPSEQGTALGNQPVVKSLPVAGILGALLPPQLNLMIGGNPETLKVWAEVEERKGSAARHVADQNFAGVKLDCETREVEAKATVDVAVATHVTPAKETSRRHYVSWLGVAAIEAATFVALYYHLIDGTAFSVITVAVVAVVGGKEVMKEWKGK